MAESRTGQRFKLQLPIRIQQANAQRRHQALTYDLSAAGVFINAKLPFRVGSRVNFDITLPAPIIGASNDVKIQCSGRVVRIEDKSKAKKRRGVACIIDRYRFVRRSKRSGGGAC